MEDCVQQTMFLLADFLHECIITLVLPHRSIAHSKMGILREYAKSLWCPQSTWVALHIKIFIPEGWVAISQLKQDTNVSIENHLQFYFPLSLITNFCMSPL